MKFKWFYWIHQIPEKNHWHNAPTGLGGTEIRLPSIVTDISPRWGWVAVIIKKVL